MKALVTGGTRGIGAAMVRALHVAGHKVASVGSDDFYPDIVNKAVESMGGIDILVNNAGYQVQQNFLDYSELDFYDQWRVMVKMPFILSQDAAKHMKSGGHIVNILSTSAFQAGRYICGYVSAKHALLGLTRAMAVELAPDIHVNAIVPGLTETDMTKDMKPERRALLESITPAGRFCKPEEIAEALMYLINSTAIYGQTITVDGGWMAKNG